MLAHTGNFEGARRGCASTEGGGVHAVPYDIPHSSVAKRQETLGTHIHNSSPNLTCVSNLLEWWVVQPIFRPPWPRTLACLALLVRHVIPLFILCLLQPSWPRSQVRVLHNLLRAPEAVYAALTMANDEMETVRELDTDFLRDFAQNLWFYYAEEDDWVGEQFVVVLRALRGSTPTESHVVTGRPGIPHAFCISASFFFLSSHRDCSHSYVFSRRRSQRRCSFAMC